jgi:magnesium transporter
MMKKRGGWLCALFLSEMLTASAMQGYEGELERAIVLTLFIPLIMSSGKFRIAGYIPSDTRIGLARA